MSLCSGADQGRDYAKLQMEESLNSFTSESVLSSQGPMVLDLCAGADTWTEFNIIKLRISEPIKLTLTVLMLPLKNYFSTSKEIGNCPKSLHYTQVS